jgi:hypothetical protein
MSAMAILRQLTTMNRGQSAAIGCNISRISVVPAPADTLESSLRDCWL